MKSPQILKKNHEFDRVYRRGRTKSGSWLNLSFAPRQKRGPRFGVAVSRKVRGAVRRNRVKRVLREILRRHLQELRGDVWLILLGRREMPRGSFPAIEKEFLHLAGKGGLLRQPQEKTYSEAVNDSVIARAAKAGETMKAGEECS